MPEADLIVVGGGPAGCAAAVMASSLGMSSVLIEGGDEVCHKLHAISSTINVLGGFASGRELAGRIADDIAKAARCDVQLGRSVTAVRVAGDHVVVETGDGRPYRARYAVVATGVRPQATAETDWISQDGGVDLKALWEAEASELDGVEALVLGADRPLGTVLRTHADLDMRLLVLHSMEEEYKTDEVGRDKRVVLLPTTHLDLFHDPDGALHLRVMAADGTQRSLVGHRLYLNLGSRPALPVGDLRPDPSGYCPPGLQHPRILVAGDLRGARYQRIMTAFGSGAEAALQAFYEMNEVGG